MLSRYDERARVALDEVVIGIIAKRPKRLLDVGCGSGRFLKRAAGKWAGAPVVEIYGVDYSEASVALSRAAVPGGNFMRCDAERLDLQDNYFDVVVCLETIEHMPKPENALQEMTRVLSPGGMLVLSVPDGDKDAVACHVSHWNEHQLSVFLKPYGEVTIQTHGELNLVASVKKPLQLASGHGAQ